MARPKVLILHATGTNRDRETALACQMAGGAPEIVHVNQLRERSRSLLDYAMLVLPGGFSYGDALGAGKLWAVDLRFALGDDLARFIESGRPVLGICNGFQALVKSGYLPEPPNGNALATLTHNASARFECRWVWLEPDPESRCIFTKGLTERITCPVAHGEGRFLTAGEEALIRLRKQGQVALRYVEADGSPADYPANPNGSVDGIAGICNPTGTVLGLMPHPEDHIFPQQHPRWTRGEGGNLGLVLFANGIQYVRGM
ncbi:MAG: phosphoribosylformylglycinamidine synthase I [Anaerolineae bacterium]